MDLDDIMLDAEERMDKAVSVYADSLKRIRAGSASPALVDAMRVDYYGSSTPLNQLASIGVPDPQLVVIKPYDPSVINDIVKAIQASDIGINPQSDGRVIRLSVPGLSEERRLQLASMVRKMAEDARVAIRNIRRDTNRHLDALEKESKIGEDECEGAREEVQEMTDRHTKKIDALREEKTEDIMRV